MNVSAPAIPNFKISPTDLVYLYKTCKRCFYDKVRNDFVPPRGFSEHFTNADRAMRDALAATEIVDLGIGLRFRVVCQGEWLESQPIPFDDFGVSLSLVGRCDAVVVTDSDEIFVVDYKTTTLDDFALLKFIPQLISYVTAIELPKSEELMLPAYVDGIAILVFNPAKFAFNRDTRNSGLYGRTRWVELPRSQEKFDTLLKGVAQLLAHDDPPRSEKGCEICRIRFGAAQTLISRAG